MTSVTSTCLSHIYPILLPIKNPTPAHRKIFVLQCCFANDWKNPQSQRTCLKSSIKENEEKGE